MENYQSNSKLPKPSDESTEPEKQVEVIEKIVTGKVIQRPKGFMHKVRDVFFGGDFKNAAKYVAGDVLLPMIRDMLFNSIITSAERTIYPDEYGRRAPMARARYQYSSLPERRYPADPREQWQPRGRIPDQAYSRRSYRSNRRDADDFIVETRAEAESIVEDMFRSLEKYQVVTLAYVKEKLGIEAPFMDNKWGWYNLHGVNIRQVREGYLIDLPPLEDV